MTKEEFIKKTIEDLPTRDLRYEMTDNEWYGWFEEVYDYALKQGQSLPIDSVVRFSECKCDEECKHLDCSVIKCK